jgi:hypothetical protein
LGWEAVTNDDDEEEEEEGEMVWHDFIHKIILTNEQDGILTTTTSL